MHLIPGGGQLWTDLCPWIPAFRLRQGFGVTSRRNDGKVGNAPAHPNQRPSSAIAANPGLLNLCINIIKTPKETK